MGDKSPKAKDRAKKQEAARKHDKEKVAADKAAKAPGEPPKKSK